MNPTIEAMARAIYGVIAFEPGARQSGLVAGVTDAAMKERTPMWRDAEAAALAALRALAAREPPKGALLTLGLLSAAGPLKRADYIEAWSAMLAELVKECERDA